MVPDMEVTFYACASKQSHHEVVTEKSVSAVCTKSLRTSCRNDMEKISVTLGASKKSDRLTKENKTLFIHK